MKVLITGANGNLATGLIPLLEGRHALRLSDLRPVPPPFHGHAFVRADVRRPEELLRAVEGMDVVVHTPAWHGIHLRERSERDFWEVNVDGTFNVLQAAVAGGAGKVVWISSTSVRTRENIYGLSKVLGEGLCAYHHQRHGLRCLVLRPGNFTPYRSNREYGERLARGGVDRRDVHQAAALAVENETVEYGVFVVLQEMPYTPVDVEAWPADPAAVLERHVPGARRLVERYAISLPERISPPDITPAREALGYRPRYTFLSFLRELADRDTAGDAAVWLDGGQ